ncbi:hypothetical protein LTR86_000275 [Recurvomyces mirabilis]|nr:hypothetical protein LTR86_000275 [Recurvomyces mirabilis]
MTPMQRHEHGHASSEHVDGKDRPGTLLPVFEKNLTWLVLFIWSTIAAWLAIILLQLCLHYVTILNSSSISPKTSYDVYDAAFLVALLVVVCRITLPSLFYRESVLQWVLGAAVFMILAYPLPSAIWTYHELSYLLKYPLGLRNLAQHAANLYSTLGLGMVVGDSTVHLVLIVSLLLLLAGFAATTVNSGDDNLSRKFALQLRGELSLKVNSSTFAAESPVTTIGRKERNPAPIRRPSILKKKTSPPNIRTGYLPNIVEILTPKPGVLDGIFATIWRKTNGRFGPRSPAPVYLPQFDSVEDTSAGAMSGTAAHKHAACPLKVESSDTIAARERLAQLRRALDEFRFQYDLLMSDRSLSGDYRKQKSDFLSSAIEKLVLRLGTDRINLHLEADDNLRDEKQQLARDALTLLSRLMVVAIPTTSTKNLEAQPAAPQQQSALRSPFSMPGLYPVGSHQEDQELYTSSVSQSPANFPANEPHLGSMGPRGRETLNKHRADTTIGWRTTLRNLVTRRAKVLNEGERKRPKQILPPSYQIHIVRAANTPGAWPSWTEVRPATPMQVTPTGPSVDARLVCSPLAHQVRIILENALCMSWEAIPEHVDLADLGLTLAVKVQVLDHLRAAIQVRLPDTLLIMQRTRASFEAAVERYAEVQALPEVTIELVRPASQTVIEFLQSLVEQHKVLMSSNDTDSEIFKHDHVYLLQAINDEVACTLDTYEALPDDQVQDMLASINDSYITCLHDHLRALDLENLQSSLSTRKALESLKDTMQHFQRLKTVYEARAKASAGSSLSLKCSQDLAFQDIHRTVWESVRALSQTHTDIRIRELAAMSLEELDVYVYHERQNLDAGTKRVEGLALNARGRGPRVRRSDEQDTDEERLEITRRTRQAARQERGGRAGARGDGNPQRITRSAPEQGEPRSRSVLEDHVRPNSSRSAPTINFRSQDDGDDGKERNSHDRQVEEPSIHPDIQALVAPSPAQEILTFRSWQQNNITADENEQERHHGEQVGRGAFEQARQLGKGTNTRGGRGRGARVRAEPSGRGRGRGDGTIQQERGFVEEVDSGHNHDTQSNPPHRNSRAARAPSAANEGHAAPARGGRGERRGGRDIAGADQTPSETSRGGAQGTRGEGRGRGLTRGRGRGVLARGRGTTAGRGRGRGRGEVAGQQT